jgi:hypothetical protein
MEILDKIFEKRGNPDIGGGSFHFMNNDKVHMSFFEIDPMTSRTEHYYNTRTNNLYRRKKIMNNYFVWEQISLV